MEIEYDDDTYTYAVVTKATLLEIHELKDFLMEKNIRIVFQKTSPLKLFIKEGEP